MKLGSARPGHWEGRENDWLACKRPAQRQPRLTAVSEAFNDEFADLFPVDPVYTTLFPKDVQQVIGQTNRYGEYAVKRPVKFQEVFATLYKNIGLDLNGTRIFDSSGVPRYLVDDGIEPLHEVI